MHDLLAEIWTTMSHNKMRTILTGISVAWGIFILIFLLGEGNGIINAMNNNTKRFLPNSMVIGSGTTSMSYKGMKEGRNIVLDEKDMKTTKNVFGKNVEDVGAQLGQGVVIIALTENNVTAMLLGVYPNEIEINKKEIIYGRFINELDIKNMRKSIVISESIAKELMPKKEKLIIGKNINMQNISFKVVGVLEDDPSKNNNEVYCPFTTIRNVYNRGNKVDQIIFSFQGLENEKENKYFEQKLKAKINTNHLAAPNDEKATWIWNRFTQNMQMAMGKNIINTALWIIGILTLISGIVGVSNIMLITVKERTKEFGIRKALGAKPRSILRLVIVESVIITTIFGYIGMVCGIAINLYMDATIGQEVIDTGLFKTRMLVNPTAGFDICFAATIVMIVAGTIAGLIPAKKAAKVRPIEALRAE